MGFAQARALVPYLAGLGIGALYLSPVLEASPGSSHGYDVTDPTRLDPVLGPPEELEGLAMDLRARGMGLLLDVVPNHMAASAHNPMWRDVLESGQGSRFARFFDVDWEADPSEQGKIVLPVLGRPYGEALEAKEIVLGRSERGLVARYWERELPLDPVTWYGVLDDAAARLPESSRSREALTRMANAARRLPLRMTGAPGLERRRRAIERLRERLNRRMQRDRRAREALDEALRVLGGRRGAPRSFDALDALLERQPWRLAYYRSGLRTLNYRRFFDIADLVALDADRDDVFETTHHLILDLVHRGLVTGLRIDHIDGLLLPGEYLGRLRAEGVPWVVVEKILVGDETLHPNWACDGTTGYEMLGALAALFVDPDGLARLEAHDAAQHGGQAATWDQKVRVLKRGVLAALFPADRRIQLRDLGRLTHLDRHARDVRPDHLALALREVTAALPVYRTYAGPHGMAPFDRRVVDRAVAAARTELPTEAHRALRFLARVLRMDLPPFATPEERDQALSFVGRWQQLTGPAMAKGVEDTALYVHNRLVSLNDVGSEPVLRGDAVARFHHLAARRLRTHPGSLSATSTHDTKRSEDVRARISVIAQLAGEWLEGAARWERAIARATGEGGHPDAEEMALLLQTAVGAFPLDAAEREGFHARLTQYVIKAAREARVHTSWLDPDPGHEARVAARAIAVLDAMDRRSGWGAELRRFQERVAFHGAVESLAQVLLQVAAPGVPDRYQGSELWDLRLVDPDNRGPVDFARRRAALEALRAEPPGDLRPLSADLRARWQDGRIKLFVLSRSLGARAADPELFLRGRYLPLEVTGPGRDHLVAFARRYRRRWAVALAPRLTPKLAPAGSWPLGPGVWRGTTVRLPEAAPTRFTDALVGHTVATRSNGLPTAKALAHLPVALFVAGGG